MNILHIGTLDNRGGAAIVSWQLRQELKKRGHTANMFVGYKHSTGPDVFVVPRYPGQSKLIRWFANDLAFSLSDQILKTEAYRQADIVHCHNLHSNFFNLATLQKISREKPVVWTAHDLWPITAGCTDSHSCQQEKPRRVLGCLWDNRPYLLKRRAQIYNQSKFHLVAPSLWLKQKLEHGLLANQTQSLIHNGINTDIFCPQSNKNELRQKLNLPLDKKIVIFVAEHGLKSGLKGSEYVYHLAEQYQNQESIVFVGLGGENKSNPRSNVISRGYINNNDLPDYYAAADILLYPSLADNCPLVVLEAMACGLPAVTFAIDGVTEIVTPDCGYAAKYRDVDDLKKGLDTILLLSKEEYGEKSNNCVKKIRTDYSLSKMTDDYLALYTKLISDF